MKNKGLLITTLLFFLTVNTAYFWGKELGLVAVVVFLILLVVYIGLIIAFIWQVYCLLGEEETAISRLMSVGVLGIVLLITLLNPRGLIDFEKLEGGNVLVAQAEGVANCTITLNLRDNFTFKETSVCFGVSEKSGHYYLQNDTIYFRYPVIHQATAYRFALIKPLTPNVYVLVRFKDGVDEKGQELHIIQNDLLP